ncbi:hypothetical protein BDC45DRAFT_600565 [Circinella umbellata]|nr:hypothetical protein BDC45DRAFT_600565 [Circinella umbellata]
MMYEERIFLIGATGNTGKPLVYKLLANPKVALTFYTRSPAKIHELYGGQPDGKVEIVQGDYSDLKPFENSIAGHSRMFFVICLLDFETIVSTTRAFAERAYIAGVQQIVFLCGIVASTPWRAAITSPVGRKVEESILTIPNRKGFVTLRPAYFMTNQIIMHGGDVHTVKTGNKIVDIRNEDETKPWISPKDIGEIAANILQDPIEKHGDAVYELIGDPRTPKEHVEILSRVLGRKIIYEKITEVQSYETMIKTGMSHLFAFNAIQLSGMLFNLPTTPGISILLGRQPQTMEQWVEENKSVFLQ